MKMLGLGWFELMLLHKHIQRIRAQVITTYEVLTRYTNLQLFVRLWLGVYLVYTGYELADQKATEKQSKTPHKMVKQP